MSVGMADTRTVAVSPAGNAPSPPQGIIGAAATPGPSTIQLTHYDHLEILRSIWRGSFTGAERCRIHLGLTRILLSLVCPWRRVSLFLP